MTSTPVTRIGWREHYFDLWVRTGRMTALHLAIWYAVLVEAE